MCCTLRACLEQVTRRILLQCVFLKVRRIPSGVISAIGMRSWPISAASETILRVLAVGGDLDSRNLVGAEMVSRKVAPICAKYIHFASHACHNLASRTPSTFYPNSANYHGLLAPRVARLAAVRPVWSNALSLGGHFIPDATRNVAVDINSTNRPEIYLASSNTEAPNQG